MATEEHITSKDNGIYKGYKWHDSSFNFFFLEKDGVEKCSQWVNDQLKIEQVVV